MIVFHYILIFISFVSYYLINHIKGKNMLVIITT